MPAATANRRVANAVVGSTVALLTVAAPLMIGGAHPQTQVALAGGAIFVVGLLLWQRRHEGVPVAPFIAVAAVATFYTFLQLVPLPSPLVSVLSPYAYQLRRETAAAGSWTMPITVDAPATWLALARAVACLALLTVTAALAKSRRWSRILLIVIAAVATAVALIGFTQKLIGTETILGFYHSRSMPGFGVFGTFVDVNHAASVLALGALIAAGLAVDAHGRARMAYGAATLICTAAVVYSTSRGGLLGFAVGALALGIILGSRVYGLSRAIVSSALLLVLAGGAALWTSDALRARIVNSHEHVWDTQKTHGWAAGAKLAAAYPWTGVGRGAFEAPVNAFRSTDDGVRLVYPENIVIQLTSELGLPVTLLLFLLAAAAAIRLAPVFVTLSPPIVAAGCGVVAVVVHELTDFGLEMLGVAFPTVVALGVVAGRAMNARKNEAARTRALTGSLALALVGCSAVAVVAAGVAMRHTLNADYDRLAAQAQQRRLDPELLQAAIARHPADDYLELLAAQHSMRDNASDAMHHLNRALWLHPANWQAHRMAARLLAALGRPAQAAIEYRLATQVGMSIGVTELVRLLGSNVVDAVAQDPDSLIALGNALYGAARPVEADLALRRACDLANPAEPVLRKRLQLALQYGARARLPLVTRELLDEATQSESFTVAAEAFARLGDLASADRSIEAGHRAHPSEGTIFLVAARLHLDGGDLTGARSMLTRVGNLSLSLDERRQAEELMAQIAERSGDEDAAVLARARARLINRQLRDINSALVREAQP